MNSQGPPPGCEVGGFIREVRAQGRQSEKVIAVTGAAKEMKMVR